MFRTDSQTVNNWMIAKSVGSNKGRSEQCGDYMKTKLGGTPTGSPADLLHLRLGQLGFTGGLQDRMNTFFCRKTGVVNPADAERAFFNNTALDFT